MECCKLSKIEAAFDAIVAAQADGSLTLEAINTAKADVIAICTCEEGKGVECETSTSESCN